MTASLEPRTERPDPDELWHRDGAMVYIIEGPGEDDSHFVADAASDDDADRFVDWHNQTLASLAARVPAAREQAATEARRELLAELRKWLFPRGFDHPGTWSLTNEGAAAIAKAARSKGESR